MKVAAIRGHRAVERIASATTQTPLGALLVASSQRGLCAIALGDTPEALQRELQGRFPRAEWVGSDPALACWMAQVASFLAAPADAPDLPLDIRGTAFQQRVWQALRKIPPGQTASYAAIAAAVGHPQAVRAVAGACAANPLAIVIPCHRVVRSDGGLGGYRWGIERKAALLACERAFRA